MNRLILIASVILLNSFTVFAQKFNMEELRKFNNMDMETFRAEIKNTYNYSYRDKTESEDYNLFEYDSPDYKRTISKFDYSDDKTLNRIQYTTVDNKEFEEFKNSMIQLKYEVTGTGTIPGTRETYTDYKLENLDIRLLEPIKGAGLNEPFTITVFK